ncbi:2'-5' RNA ligase family protein [Sphingobacterium oryzagri]|uniref:2'-5' RNA ligase family protein n=1 Tax=Sphingobacterium oryzagri TaxID=3025669 RepID=A0ABY7WLQ4_9SPHI|nr:2'-5' RNA ligase family protein [Sphingobacterium sp. KACC 22765]WDF69930.1 2'-5' RNA ligase family protein [Sphingobacterium sp. KACC 22765]
MDTKHTISIVFQPCEQGIRFVAALKERVRRLLNKWYPSCNSTAHVTICRMKDVSDEQLTRIIDLLATALRYEHAQHIYFDSFATYPSSGTFFIDPTVQSKAFLLHKMRKVIAEVEKVMQTDKSRQPHLTISRGLDSQNLREVKDQEEFKILDFDFFCKGIVLRKFDEEKKQYVAFLEIPFGNEKRAGLESGQQLSFGF